MPSDPDDHYFTARPASARRPRTVRVELDGDHIELLSDAGLFSPDRVDPGTAVLLRAVPDPPPEGDLLDLGSGYGILALAMAKRSPGARVWAVDVNERARECATINADRLGLDNITVCRPEDELLPAHFDAIWSNPPIRIGKPALHELLQRWLARLAERADAHLVVQKHLGADSLHRWITQHGFDVERVASKRGYRILRVTRVL